MTDLKRILEALLFAADEPISSEKLSESLNVKRSDIEQGIGILEREYQGRSISVKRVDGGFIMVTRPEYKDVLREVLSKRAPSALSRGALETLAVVAYRQPVTKQDIEAIRGVSPDASLETLLERGLVREAGRKKTLGRPKLYATTSLFLQRASLNSLDDLPLLSEDEPV